MKTISRSKLLLTSLLGLLALASCRRYQELPEVGREDVSARTYRLPDSQPMSDDDAELLKQIQDEYKQNAQ